MDAGSGIIDLDADEDIAIGQLTTTDATATAVMIVSTNGGVTDVAADAIVDITTGAAGTLTIDAETGIGSANALETSVGFIDIVNATGGNILIDEVVAGGALGINEVDQDFDTGTVIIRTLDGTLTVVAGEEGVAATTGEITLDAQDAGVSGDDDLVVNDTVVSTSGKINLDAANDVIFGADGDVTSTSGEIEVAATDAITMVDGTVLDAGSGIIDLDADEDIAIGRLVTTDNTPSAVSIISTSGAVTDSGNIGGADIEATAANAKVTISAVTGVGTFINPIETAASAITAGTHEGDIDIDNDNTSGTTASLTVTTGTGNILFSQDGDGALDVTSATTTDGSIGIDVDNANLTAGTVTADGAGDVVLTTTTSGDVIVDSVTALDNMITINSEGGISEVPESPEAVDLTAAILSLTADTGIGATDAIETAAGAITARTIDPAANILIRNENTAPTSLNASTVGTGSWIVFNQTGGGELTLADVSTADSYIHIRAESGNIVAEQVDAGGPYSIWLEATTNGDVIVDSVTAAGDAITIFSDNGAIREVSESPEAVDLTAAILSLTADTGIGVTDAIETSATSITASTDEGDIDIDNDNSSGTTASLTVTTGTGNILFSQEGGGNLEVALASTANGNIDIDATANVTLGSLTALGNQITINSDGAIDDAVPDAVADLTADTLILTANDGIGAGNSIETAASAITARTIDLAKSMAHIVISNDNMAPTSLNASTVGTDSWIVFDQTGGGELTLVDVSTVDGLIDISTESGNIVATLVDAGGLYDIWLETTTSGDVIVDSVTALGNTIMIYSALGAIREVSESPEVVDLTAATLNLSAATGIGATDAIETDVTSLQASSTTGDIVIVEKDDVTLNNIRAHAGNIFLEATDGGMSYGSDRIEAGAGTLTLIQKEDLDLANFTFGNQSSTDLTAQSYNGSFTADNTKVANAADKWQSITATAQSDISLEGPGNINTNALESTNGNIKIASTTGSITAAGDITATNGGLTMTAGGNITTNIVNPTNGNIQIRSTNGGDLRINNGLTVNGGGVSLISENGWIYTPDSNPTARVLDVPITGYSDNIGTNKVGVDLPAGADKGKAAIVIRSEKDLTLGLTAALTAKGSYDDSVATGVDDRKGVYFLPPPPNIVEAGERIDIAIYLGSFGTVSGDGGNVTVDSTVSMPAYGTMVIDAYDTVHSFGSNFTNSDPWDVITNTNSLEVVSRISQTLDDAAEHDRLPYADEARLDMPPPWFNGEYYILRGIDTVLAQVLAKVEPVPLVVPMPLAPEDQGQVQIERRDAELLGLGDKPELARAYPPSLNTDLNMDKAAQRLYALVPILSDNDRIAILNRIVVENWQDVDQPIAPEQEAMIAQRMSGTPAEEWVAALTEYVDVLSTMVGRPKTASVLWVMQTYVIPQAEEGLIQDQTVAFLEAQID